jgi:hypothetical protein
MKKVLLFIAFFSGTMTDAFAQYGNALPIKILRLDSITPLGKPDGDAESKEIGDEGGTIISADGRLELLFPQGALRKKKKITVQPVINHAANGRGKAYRLLPAGIVFEKPVAIIFYYAEDEMEGSLPGLKGIAGQDEMGKWEVLQNIATDTIAKTITAHIRHFSTYTSFDKIVLKPAAKRVKVERTESMWLSVVNFQAGELSDGDLPPLPPRINIPEPGWNVNGIPRGDQHNGWISGDGVSVIYNAPASVPTDNPVAVAVTLKGLQFTFNKIVFKDPVLVSHLLIYDRAYRISMGMWVDNSEDGMCTMRWEDYGEFTLVLEGTRAMVKEISNKNLHIRFNPCKCGFIWLNRPLVKGPINIVGASRIEVTAASLPATPFARVRIMLQHGSSPLPDFKTPCPVSGLPPASLFGNMLRYFLPPFIQFEANNTSEQVITLADLSQQAEANSRRHGLRIVIKRIEEEQ